MLFLNKLLESSVFTTKSFQVFDNNKNIYKKNTVESKKYEISADKFFRTVDKK